MTMKPQLLTALRFLFVLTLFAALPAHAASFDCAKAASRTEKLICADQTLSALDDDMAAAYKAALAKGDPPAADLVKNQKAWLPGLSRCAPSGMSDADATSCLTNLYRQRVEFLGHAKICRIDRLDDCNDTNQVMWNGGDKAVRRFIGQGAAADEVIGLLGGAPEDLQHLPNGWFLAAACRAHDCGSKGAMILTRGGDLIATAALTYRCGEIRCVNDYRLRVRFRSEESRADVVQIFENWAKTALDDFPSAHLGETQAQRIEAP